MDQTTEQQQLRQSERSLWQELERAGKIKRRGNTCCCPFHEDKHPSAGIYQDDEKIWRFKCHGCGVSGDVFDIRARIEQKTPGDMLKELRGEQPKHETNGRTKAKVLTFDELFDYLGKIGKPSDVFSYTHPTTNVTEMIVVRIETANGKTFRQARVVPGGFVPEAVPKPRPLYRRDRIAATDSVIVVEGEKCVHAAESIGLVATTSPCGADNAEHADWTPLAGKTVYLWPDNDQPEERFPEGKGVAHMRTVARLLEQIRPAVDVFWIDPRTLNLPPKGDIADFLNDRDGAEPEALFAAVSSVLETAESFSPSRGLEALLEETIAGRRVAVSWPWEILGAFTNALLPGTVTCVCGDPGATKSLLLLEATLHWLAAEIPFAVFEMEESREHRLNRALAQLDNNANLTDPAWIKENPTETRGAFHRHRKQLNELGRCITDAPDNEIKLPDLLTWTEQQAKQGCRVIVVDPVTAAATSDKPWIDDHKFIMSAKRIAGENKCSIILVTHPRKGAKTSGLHDIAGGSAYQRFAQTVLWIERYDGKREVKLRTAQGETIREINRSVKIRKSRNGRGAGLELGFRFRSRSLRFDELGVFTK